MLGLPGCANLAQNPRKPRPIAPGAKVRVAQIGCGGKGWSDLLDTAASEWAQVIAILAAAGFKLTSVSGASGNNHRFDRNPI